MGYELNSADPHEQHDRRMHILQEELPPVLFPADDVNHQILKGHGTHASVLIPLSVSEETALTYASASEGEEKHREIPAYYVHSRERKSDRYAIRSAGCGRRGCVPRKADMFA